MPRSDSVKEARDVNGFRRVVLAGVGVLRVKQGGAEALTVEAPADVIELVTSEVEDGTLTLGMRRGAWPKGLRRDGRTIRFDLTVTEIEGITLAGAGDVLSDGISTDELSLTVSGAGSLRMDGLTAVSLIVVLSGAGDCEISGEVESQEIKIAGAGSCRARSLKSKAAKVLVSGTGSVEVSVDDTLDAQVTGTGSVRYHGEPTVFQRVTGVGSVEFARG